MKPSLIEFCHVTKRYGSLYANDDLCLSIEQGEIHAVIGENGAGKSTAMKLLFGLETPTAGEIKFNGEPRPWQSPQGALKAGLGMVHQHFMLSPVHTALDNVILGQEFAIHGESDQWWGAWLKPIKRDDLLARLEQVAKAAGFNIPWLDPVESLPVGVQQQLEICKLLFAGVDVMIFDEPTAVLSPAETDGFLQMVRTLHKQGKTILIITHKLGEVKAIADRVTVLRKGKSVATRYCHDLSVQAMADLMVGRHVNLGAIKRNETPSGQPLVQISNLTLKDQRGRQRLSDVSLTVQGGQIVGIAGVEGSGQSELFHAVLDPARTLRSARGTGASISVLGCEGSQLKASHVRRLPIGIVPADRLREAVLPQESLLENDLLGHDHEFGVVAVTGYQWLDRAKARTRLADELKVFDVRPADPAARLCDFSGGNQQKFVMARELSRNPKLILCAQPTRGVDVGSIEQIHGELIARRDAGAGILLISSQLDELMALSDVIHVMFGGRIVARFDRKDFDERPIGLAMGGGVS